MSNTEKFFFAFLLVFLIFLILINLKQINFECTDICTRCDASWTEVKEPDLVEFLTDNEAMNRLLGDGYFRLDYGKLRDNLIEAYIPSTNLGDYKYNLYVYDSPDKEDLYLGEASSVDFSPNMKWLAVGSIYDELILFKAEEKGLVKTYTQSIKEMGYGLEFSPEEDYLLLNYIYSSNEAAIKGINALNTYISLIDLENSRVIFTYVIEFDREYADDMPWPEIKWAVDGKSIEYSDFNGEWYRLNLLGKEL